MKNSSRLYEFAAGLLGLLTLFLSTTETQAQCLPASPSSVTQSSQYSTAYVGTLANLTDGDFTAGVGTASGTQWVRLDFGTPAPMTAVKLSPLNQTGWGPGYLNGAKLQVSNDATTWTDVLTISGTANNTLSTFPIAVTGRYIRILGTNYVGVSEFQVTTAGLSVQAVSGPAYVGQPLSLSAVANQAGSYTYAWSGPPGVTITPTNAANPVATGLALGVSSFTVVVTASPTCQKTATVAVSALNPPCTNGLGGLVFNDFDGDGVKSGTATTGISGVTVKVYDCQGNLLGTATTDELGRYSFMAPAFTTTTMYPVRVEFSNLPAGYRATANGSDGRTDVQIIPAPDCNVDFGAIKPGDYCQVNPDIVTACFVSVSNLPNDPALIAFKPSEVNQPALAIGNARTHAPQMTERSLSVQSQIGTIGGLAYHRSSQTVLAAAFARTGSPLPNGPGAIYKITNPNATTPSSATLLIVPNVGTGAITAIDVGKKGLGNLELSADQQTLYTINLNTRALVSIPLVGPALTPGPITEIPIPAPADCQTDYRPFAIRQHNGKLYIGVTCGAPLAADLKAYVYEYDGTTFTQKLVVPFTYERADATANFFGSNDYRSNNAGFVDWNTYPNLTVAASGVVAKTQPWLTDIAFDGDDMILGVRSRLADVINNSWWVIGGDILRACQTSAGSWSLENNGVCGGKSTQVPPPVIDPYTGGVHARDNSKGPGGYEYYWGDDGFEGEASQGSLLQIPGYPHVFVSQVDAIGHSGQVGIMAMNNTSGRVTAAGNVFFGYTAAGGYTPGNIGKSNGLGAITALCNAMPIEIGNRVWIDNNKNGVQDPCADEPAVAGIKVNLYDNTGKLVGKTTTDANGEYYFNQTNVNTNGVNPTTGAPLLGTVYTGLAPLSQYYAVFGNDGASPQFNTSSNTLTVAGTSYELTTANSTANNGNDQNDSDATLASGSPVSAANGFPTISLTTPDAGANHTFDVGLVRSVITPATLVLAKTVNKSRVERGGIVTYTVSLTNTSATSANNVVVTDTFSTTGLSVVGSAMTSSGTFVSSTTGGSWTIPALAGGAVATLSFQAQVNTEGPVRNVASIDNITSATACLTVPFHVCANEAFEFDLSVPTSYSTYQWSRNDILIPGATSATYTVTAVGEYTVATTSAAGCPDGSCCPFVVVADPVPGLTARAVAATCNGATPLNDARITLVGSSTNAVSYNITLGSSFTASAPLFATNQLLASVVGGVLLANQPNPLLAPGTSYTIRVYTAEGCYSDVAVVIPPAMCQCPAPICVPFVVKKVVRR